LNEIDLGAKALWTLLPASSTATLAALAVYSRFSDRALLRRTTNRIAAHLYELRLFLDEPALVFGAQRDLIRENLRLLRIVALPSAILVLPFALLFLELDAFYGRAPLAVGEPAIVTIQITRSAGESMPAAQLTAPAGVNVETPAVHALAANQMSWRIRPKRPLSGHLEILLHGRTLTKTISAGAGVYYLSQRRAGTFPDFLLHPIELPFHDPAAAWIEIDYPAARVHGLPWLAWFVFGSVATALAYRLLS
jgi:hypothetical protein